MGRSIARIPPIQPLEEHTVVFYIYAIIAYIGLCMLLGLLGRHRKLGSWGYFFGSLVLTPVIGLLLLLASDSRKGER